MLRAKVPSEPSCFFEQEARLKGYTQIAGIDEAGRGPLAGPVVAAACIIQEGLFFKGVNDSKQLTESERERLFDVISTHPGVKWAVSFVDADVIDEINILQATIRAMIQSADQLSVKPDFLLVDGLKLPHTTIPSQKIIRGDALSQSIAAASILAKVSRDRLMKNKYHEEFPQYNFGGHKGYGTPGHLRALLEHGPCAIHRRSFAPIKTL